MEQQTRSQIYKVIPIPGIDRFLAYLSNGEVTHTLIQDTLNKKHVGREYFSYSSPGGVGNTVWEMLAQSKKWHRLTDEYKLSTYTLGNECTINWRGLPLGKVIVHKKKGRYHYGHFGSGYYEWIISSIEVIGFEDIQARVNEILAIEARNKAATEQKLIDACNMVKAIQALFPNDTEWAIRSKIDWLQKNQYKVFDYLNKEVQG